MFVPKPPSHILPLTSLTRSMSTNNLTPAILSVSLFANIKHVIQTWRLDCWFSRGQIINNQSFLFCLLFRTQGSAAGPSYFSSIQVGHFLWKFLETTEMEFDSWKNSWKNKTLMEKRSWMCVLANSNDLVKSQQWKELKTKR